MAYETADEIMRLCDIVRQTGFDLHKQGDCVEQQSPIAVLDEDGMPLGDNFADLLFNFGAPKYEIKKYVLSYC